MGVENGVKEEDIVAILEDADALIAPAVGETMFIIAHQFVFLISYMKMQLKTQ